jgi:hypothetical protein
MKSSQNCSTCVAAAAAATLRQQNLCSAAIHKLKNKSILRYAVATNIYTKSKSGLLDAKTARTDVQSQKRFAHTRRGSIMLCRKRSHKTTQQQQQYSCNVFSCSMRPALLCCSISFKQHTRHRNTTSSLITAEQAKAEQHGTAYKQPAARTLPIGSCSTARTHVAYCRITTP